MIVFQLTTPRIFFQYRFAWWSTKLQGCHGGLTKFFTKLKTNNRKQPLVSILYETFGVKRCTLYYNHADVYCFTYIQASLSDRHWHMTYMLWHITDTRFKLFPDRCIFLPKVISLSMYGAFLFTMISVIGISKCSQISWSIWIANLDSFESARSSQMLKLS